MAGEFVPVVMIPRFTTLAGQPSGGFTTIGMNVANYSRVTLNTYCGPVLRDQAGTPGTPKITFEESTDQDNWTDCSGVTSGGDPLTPSGEKQYGFDLSKRWFRIKIAFEFADEHATFWSMGHFERRES